MHQENENQNLESSDDTIENIEQVQIPTETPPDIEDHSIPSDISFNNEFINNNPEAFRTVADGFRKAEETQKPVVETPNVTTEETLVFDDTESTVIPGSTTYPTTEVPGDTEDRIGRAMEGLGVAQEQSTVLGHSTVLEIRSSQPKVCFPNGKCIVARDLKRR